VVKQDSKAAFAAIQPKINPKKPVSACVQQTTTGFPTSFQREEERLARGAAP
jgi:hypothetical protein